VTNYRQGYLLLNSIYKTISILISSYSLNKFEFLPRDASAERGDATVNSKSSVCLSVRP